MNIVESLDTRAVIAMLALFVAVWSIFSSRRHNKLTVKPYLYTSIESNSVNLRCRFFIVNKGLGPAIIKESTYFLDGNQIEFNDLLKTVKNLPEEFGLFIKDLKPGCAIAKDESHNIILIEWDGLKFDLPNDNDTKRKTSEDIKSFAAQINKRLGFSIKYESSYGEKGELKSFPQ